MKTSLFYHFLQFFALSYLEVLSSLLKNKITFYKTTSSFIELNKTKSVRTLGPHVVSHSFIGHPHANTIRITTVHSPIHLACQLASLYYNRAWCMVFVWETDTWYEDLMGMRSFCFFFCVVTMERNILYYCSYNNGLYCGFIHEMVSPFLVIFLDI